MTSKESRGAVACKEVSEKKKAANRRNAQKSTGPKTQAGKDRSRWNAMKHGLLAKHAVIPGYEDQKVFDSLLRAVRAEFQPCGVISEMLVERIAVCYWDLGRVAAFKQAHIAKHLNDKEKSESSNHPLLSDFTIGKLSQLEKEKADSWLRRTREWEKAARISLVRTGTCSPEEAQAMSSKEAVDHLRSLVGQARKQAEEKGRTVPNPLGSILMTNEFFQKLLRYETTIENTQYKALRYMSWKGYND